MLDSSAKVPDGILVGNIVQLGNYDECVEVKDIPSEFGAFSGQHCMVLLGRSGDEPRKIESVLKMTMSNEVEIRSALVSLTPKRWSLCVPSSCRPSDVIEHLHSVFSNVSIRADDVTCSDRAHAVILSFADWFAIAVGLAFTLLLVLSTSYDLITLKSDRRRSLWLAFSVRTNGKDILHVSPSGGGLRALDGVRSLSTLWMIYFHRSILYIVSPSINTRTVLEWTSDWQHLITTNGSLFVDTFFLMSGLLVCYNFLKKMDANVKFDLIDFYRHRFIRLSPPYLALILFATTFFAYTDDGPYWNLIATHEKEICQKHWWSAVSYVSNYANYELEMCIPHTWYLAADMQLYIMSPLILYPMWKWRRMGKLLLGILILFGLIITFLIPYFYEIRSSGLTTDFYRKMYFPTHARFTPWLMGIGLGYILHQTKHRPVRLSTVHVVVGWVLSAGLLLTSFLLAHRFLQPDHEYERVFESLYLCLMRPTWALGVAWVIFACLKGYGGFVNTFLSWDVFRVFSKLSYSLYLIHIGIVVTFMATIRLPQYMNDTQNVIAYLGATVLSVIAATVMTLYFEKPFIILERHAFGKQEVKTLPK